jgi:DMSO reductase anchor subunit
MTYTDLSSEFEANKAAFESAWMSMTSIDVKGQAPRRYQQAILAGAGLSGLALLFGMLAVARRLRAKKSIEREGSEEAMFSSSGHVSSVPMTVSGVWNLAEKRFEEQHLSDVAHFS